MNRIKDFGGSLRVSRKVRGGDLGSYTKDITLPIVELKSGWRRNGRGAYPRGLEPKTMSNAGELTR